MGETDGVIPQIRTGSVVRLKSGGPLMTVERNIKVWNRTGSWWNPIEKLESSGYWLCDWITDTGKPQTEKYLIEQLKVEHI